MATARLTSKGQLTLPKQIRDYLHLHSGDKLDFVIESEGRVLLRPTVIDVRDLKGILKGRTNKVVSIEEMNEAIAQGAIGRKK